jgi:UDP-glucuronate 4-epimerase
MSKTVLITGAAGFIGSHLADALLARGDSVVAVDCFNDYYDPAIKRRNIAAALEDPKYHLRELDIGDCDAVLDVFRETRPDVVVHLAARAGVRPSLEHPRRYYDVNIRASENILDAMRETRPSHLVFASSSSVYGGNTKVPFSEADPVDTPVSIYAATKRMNELQAHVHHHLYGTRVSMMRFFTVYGPRQRPDMAIHKFTERMLAGQPIPMYGDGSTRRDYTYIDDIVQGLLQTVDRPFDYEIFNLGESHTTSLRELVDLLAGVLGVTPQIEQLPLQPGDVQLTYADISKARELLGYRPATTMREGLEKFAAWRRDL